ncbi:hypothetical protein [Streptomyces sp. ME19-01-6]|uniref:hypothetical protein n=1 Tax=Streptomyces sp. ME19-01-6 TaxID=3028686 RepID=UPI0029AAA640|nr:hypothetical protein [Streptomyces sp. ME19-01-6]MDX3232289.1 hypothetical protein [Streptomyces sp. ME19-01-6]
MSEDLRQLITRHQLRGIRTGALAIVITVHVGSALPALLAGLDEYRHPWVPLTAYGLLTLILGGSVLVGIGGRPWPRGWVPLALVCAFAASVATTTQVPADQYFVGRAHWSFSLVGWFAVVLLGHRGLAAFGVFTGCHLAVIVAQLLAAEVPPRAIAASMALRALSACCLQMTIAAGAKLLLNSSTAIGEALRAQERVCTRIAVGAQIQADQRQRYAELNTTVIPLLTGLADGSLDPQDDEVRRACALEAARLRRLFAESDFTFDPLVHEMRACIDAAERNGTTVLLAVRGDPLDLPLQLRRALLDPVIATLAAAGETARVTVVRGEDQVRVGIVVDALRDRLPEAAASGIRVRTVQGEHHCLVEAACRITARPARSDRPEPPWPQAWPSWSPGGRRWRT